jgi:hypothetical protein
MLRFGYSERAALGKFQVCSMATVIYRAFTGDGFVVGADGRSLNSDTGEITSETKQKVFCYSGADNLAFSFAGTVSLGYRDTVMFDFIQAFGIAVKAIPPDRAARLGEYARLLAEPVLSFLTDARRRAVIKFTQEEHEREPTGMFTIATVNVDGYFRGIPARIELRFSHTNQVPQAQIGEMYLNNQPLVYAPSLCADGLWNDARLVKYRTVQNRRFHDSDAISKSIHEAKSVIDAHGSPEARAINPLSVCVGGKTHIATVTPGEGFKWVGGFEPIAPDREPSCRDLPA